MSAPTSDFLTDYIQGFAQLLADDDGSPFTWRVSQQYEVGEVGIFDTKVPVAPDRIVTLTPVPMAADPTLSNSQIDLQVRLRGGADIRDLRAMRAATRLILGGRFPVRLPTGVYVSSLVFAYGGSLGQDDSKRWMHSDNYRTRASEPVQQRP